MRQSLPVLLIRHYLFWMLVFNIGRLVFLFWNKEELQSIPFTETLSCFLHAIYLDTAMSCWILMAQFLPILLFAISSKEIFRKINLGITLILLILISLITFSELPIYDEWHTKLNYKAIWFMQNPSEVIHTASWTQLIFGIFSSGMMSLVFFWMYKRYSGIKTLNPFSTKWQGLVYALTFPVLFFFGARGGFQPIPIQLSDAYFSTSNILNQISVNSCFNLASSCIENSKAGEPYSFMTKAEADTIFAKITEEKTDTTIQILSNEKPNIVLVVLESWSADLVKSCGGYDSSITPSFEKLAEEGILFTNCYASGSLSDQGMAAIFSGFPAQPLTSIITDPNKYVKLPCVNTELEKIGYHTSFMFGGQLSYGNIRAYMYYNGFDKIIEGKDFDERVPKSHLGVADQYLFDRQLAELKTEKEPFFASMFTLSTHGPFDFPMEEKLHWGDKEKPYINSVLYADGCIHDFIEKAKKEPWYKNTLFVFVSDHSHNSPRNWAFNQAAYRHIPLLFFGDVIKPEYRGMKYDSISSQTDLAATLLAQLKQDHSKFIFSRNLFNPTSSQFAYYAFDEGFGWIKPEGKLTWHVKDARYEYDSYKNPNDKARLTKEGQAFLQRIMEAYVEY
jgi:phosphoglycerol transferase MdoB-like AlkP superfamily enzyme